MNYNGVLSFGIERFIKHYATPFPFRSPPLIAPFWDDINFYLWKGLYYRQTNDSDLLQLFHNYTLLLNNGDSNTELLHYDYYPIHLFVATWDKAPRYFFFYFFGTEVQLYPLLATYDVYKSILL